MSLRRQALCALSALALTFALAGAAMAQSASCSKQDWNVAEFSDGSRIEVQERREGLLRYEALSPSGSVQEMQVRDGFIIEWMRAGRRIQRYLWSDAPARFRPLKPGMTFSATARVDLPDRPQLLETSVVVGQQVAVKIGACTYQTFEVVQTNIVDKGQITQKVVRHFHEKSGLTLRTTIYAVAGHLEREIARVEATALR